LHFDVDEVRRLGLCNMLSLELLLESIFVGIFTCIGSVDASVKVRLGLCNIPSLERCIESVFISISALTDVVFASDDKARDIQGVSSIVSRLLAAAPNGETYCVIVGFNLMESGEKVLDLLNEASRDNLLVSSFFLASITIGDDFTGGDGRGLIVSRLQLTLVSFELDTGRIVTSEEQVLDLTRFCDSLEFLLESTFLSTSLVIGKDFASEEQVLDLTRFCIKDSLEFLLESTFLSTSLVIGKDFASEEQTVDLE
jgi:hypothetical protein